MQIAETCTISRTLRAELRPLLTPHNDHQVVLIPDDNYDVCVLRVYTGGDEQFYKEP